MPPEYCAACYCRKVYCHGCKAYHCQCSWSTKNCRTAFRKYLNQSDYKHHNGRFQQQTRLYGDYLYYQDRERFEMEFKEWSQSNN